MADTDHQYQSKFARVPKNTKKNIFAKNYYGNSYVITRKLLDSIFTYDGKQSLHTGDLLEHTEL
jgi:hypothetical protein